MIIQKTEPYDDNRKTFKVIEYCCKEMGKALNYFTHWAIYNDDMMQAGDWDEGIEGRYCCYCGKQIIIKS